MNRENTIIDKKDSYKLFNDIARTYDPLNKILSMGIDKSWRRTLVKHLPKYNVDLCLDIATGTGDTAILLGKTQRIKKIIAVDPSIEMIKIGRKKVESKNLNSKISFITGQAETLEMQTESLDLATVTFGIRNFRDLETSLKNIHRILKKDGRLYILEFSLPKLKLIRAPYLFYFRKVLPWVGNKISKHQTAYNYLNKTVESFPYGEQLKTILKDAGFKKVRYTPLTLGIATLYIAQKD